MTNERAAIVVVGGGITGCSVAYYLAKAGLRDVLLLEKDELTSGSTCHAAGLVTQFNPSPTMMRFRRYSVELYRELGVFDSVGEFCIASSPRASRSSSAAPAGPAGSGSTSRCLPDEVLRMPPAATRESLYGSGLDRGRRLGRSPHRDAHARERRSRARRADRDRTSRHRDPTRTVAAR